MSNVVRFRDYEHRSKEPDAVHRDPTEPCIVIILPVVRIERYDPTVSLSLIIGALPDSVWR